MHLKLLIIAAACLLAGCQTNPAVASRACEPQAGDNVLGKEIARVALDEYRQFNGHRIDASGRLWKFGAVESETALLHDPETGDEATDIAGRYAWRRVWQYWQALDKYVAGDALWRKLVYVPDLLDNPATGAKPKEMRLRDLFAQIGSNDPDVVAAIRQSAVRAAINDTPWSATFISYLMDRAHLDSQQFHYSSAHWQYIKDAFADLPGYAYRACDPLSTVPKAGDLICYSRGDKGLTSFSHWKRAVESDSFSTGAHCDVVVDVDKAAKKMETVGGNVMQSVARRQLKLNTENVLSASHHPDHATKISSRQCRQDPTCTQDNLNLQYWSVLLQLN